MNLFALRLQLMAMNHLLTPLPRPPLDSMLDSRRKPVLVLLALVVSAAGALAVLALGLSLLAR